MSQPPPQSSETLHGSDTLHDAWAALLRKAAPFHEEAWGPKMRFLSWFLPVMVVYVSVSAGLVCFNKFLMHAERFPFPAVIVLFQMTTCSCLSGALFLWCPAYFPGLAKSGLGRGAVVRSCLPISLFFMMELMFGTAAMLHASVAFLQMVKESAVVWVYALSLFVAVEVFCWRKATILLFTLVGTAMTIRGERHFAPAGLALQSAGVLSASCKAVLQQMVLQSRGLKLDALSYVLVMSPMSMMLLAGLLLSADCWSWHHSDMLGAPHWREVLLWSPQLLANAMCAFFMNILIAVVLKNTSALSVTLCGLTKDAAIVFGGWLVGGNALGGMQGLGFAVQLAGVGLWSLSALLQDSQEGMPLMQPEGSRVKGGALQGYRAADSSQEDV
jgi:hypothetical protein